MNFMRNLSKYPLGEIAEINPKGPAKGELGADDAVDFLPMADLHENGSMRIASTRRYEEVAKGYTAFKSGDVLLAKITPCFENNKISLADVGTDWAFGSTEFHVLRSGQSLDPKYLTHFLRQDLVREAGEKRMTGSAGQRRVPKAFVEELEIPLPPLSEQKRIAGILDQAEALRRLRARALEKLNTLGQAIFQEMFGDPKTEPNKWPTVSFSDACTDETSKSPKVQRGNYATEGPVPVVDQGQKLIAGYTDPRNACVSFGPIILFGDHTRAVKFIDFNFAIGADGAKVLKPSHRYEPIFFFALLSRLPIPDLGYSRHMREVKKLRFPVPNMALQSLFAEKMKALRAQENLLSNAMMADESLFTSLQHRAFRGEL